MNIQPATAVEASLLAWLDQACDFSAHWDKAAWQETLAQPACKVWMAELDGKLAGFLALRGAADQYEIVNLAVEAACRRQGIGLRLVQHALAQLPGGDVTLEVSIKNMPAISLYEKAGFVCRGVRKQFYKDGSDAQVMGKRL